MSQIIRCSNHFAVTASLSVAPDLYVDNHKNSCNSIEFAVLSGIYISKEVCLYTILRISHHKAQTNRSIICY